MLSETEILEIWKEAQNGKIKIFMGDGVKLYNTKYYVANFTKKENFNLKAVLSSLKAQAYILRDLTAVAPLKQEKRYCSVFDIPKEYLRKVVVSISPTNEQELLIIVK